MHKLLIAALATAFSSVALAQSADVFDPSERISSTPVTGVEFTTPRLVLFNQGPLTNGTNGATPISILNNAAPFGYNTLGFSGAGAFRLADDFTVPAGESWNLEAITVFGYQTGATAASINAATLQILNGAPPAGAVVFGNTTTSIPTTTTLSGAFRVTPTTLTATNRAIQAVRIPVAVTLSPGTYFIDFTTAGTVASGPFFPPLVPNIAAPAPTGNALQFATTWNPLRMGLTTDPTGTSTGPQQGLPFIVEGTINLPVATPSMSVFGMLALALLLLVAGWFTTRR